MECVLGDAIGKKFVQTHFSEESKVSVLAIVHGVKNALLYRLTKLEWMSQDTKKNVLKKLENINIKMGYPDKYTHYTRSKLIPENISRTSSIPMHSSLQTCPEKSTAIPTLRNQWYMTPQTINAYHNHSFNEIIFPAAFLSPPFFYHNDDPTMN